MNAEEKTIMLALASLIVGIAAIINETYRIYLLALYPVFITLYLVSSYIKK